jgi:ParB-like chromosome segregation protein Spo0J
MGDRTVIDARSFIDVPVHPAADLFPMIDGDAFVALINDIKARGQEYPVVMWDGRLVDGRNRYAACRAAGIRPKIKNTEFKSEVDATRFIVSTNIHRRHLTESQRAMIATELAKLGNGVNKGKEAASIEAASLSQDEAADAMQVGRSSVQRARQVAEHAPDLAAKVKSGEMKVSKAAAIVRERMKPQTNPDRADDAVIDKKIERAADGYTPKMERAWAAYSALDAVEQTAFRERMEK